ncbi:MAG: Gldg family protein [Planctomycetota bacterium]
MRALATWWALFRREVLSLLVNTATYVAVTLFVVITSLNFYIVTLESGLADFAPVTLLVQFLGIFFVPLLTMRLFAEERRTGTIELLMTAPVRPTEVVLAKWAAALLLYGVMLSPCLVYAALLAWAGDVDRGQVLAALLGLGLLGSVYVAAGLLVSALTRSQIAAAMGTIALLLVGWSAWWLGEESESAAARAWRHVSFKHHFDNSLAKGVLDSADVLFFATLTVFLLFCTWAVLVVLEDLGRLGGERARRGRRLGAGILGAVAAELALLAWGVYDVHGRTAAELLQAWQAGETGPLFQAALPAAGALLAGAGALALLGAWWTLGVAAAAVVLAALSHLHPLYGAAGAGIVLLLIGAGVVRAARAPNGRRLASTAAGTAAVALLLVNVNIFAARHAVRMDLSEARLNTLNPVTTHTLAALDAPVEITVFFTGQERYEGVDLLDRTRSVLEEFRAASPQVRVEYIDPVVEPTRAQARGEALGLDLARLPGFCAIRYADRRGLIPWDTVVRRDSDALGQKSFVFQGERAFTSAIRRLMDPRTKKIYFTAGHGEYGLFGPEKGARSLAALARELRVHGFAADQVDLAADERVPEDCDVLAIVGPTERFGAAELAALDAYVDGGGRLLALLDPRMGFDAAKGLPGWLAHRGVELHANLLEDPDQNVGGAASFLLTSGNPEHPITASSRTVRAALLQARSVAVAPPEGTAEGWSAETVLFTSPRAVAKVLDRRQGRLRTSMTGGPFPCAAAASGPKGARIAVIGDADLAGGYALPAAHNRAFLVSSIHWLCRRAEPIAIPDRADVDRSITLAGADRRLFWWVALVGTPQVFLLAGLFVWWSRRS